MCVRAYPTLYEALLGSSSLAAGIYCFKMRVGSPFYRNIADCTLRKNPGLEDRLFCGTVESLFLQNLRLPVNVA